MMHWHKDLWKENASGIEIIRFRLGASLKQENISRIGNAKKGD